jgi:HTH-type transcriptional regulator/antitoxin HigA
MMSGIPPELLAYEPDVVHPPGTHLATWLKHHNMSQAEFARRVGLSTKHVNQITNGAVSLTPEVAVAFEKVTNLSARFWTRLEAAFRAQEARREDDAALEADVAVLREFPMREMERRGYFKVVGTTKVAKVRELLSFFSVANVEALRTVAMQPAALRPSKAFKPNEAALAAWIRRAEILAADIETTPFNRDRCNEALVELRRLTYSPGTTWLEPLASICAGVGIALVIERELPGCRINGATKWLSPNKAMVALSLRHRRHDIFWFTFFHELAHLLRHSRRQTFIDAVGLGLPEELELDADRFASRLLIPPEHESDLASLHTEQQVVSFAEKIGVSPAIVVGRMQHENLILPNRWTHLIPRYKFSPDD